MTGLNNKLPLVSVIINCYNGEEYLKEAIDSVCSQTYTNWEIIFWDNCSTDHSAQIAISYGEKLKYYKAVENKPLGQARNCAVEKADGKYICFIDCDDIWLNDKLKLQVDLMENNPQYVLCYGSIEEVFLNGQHFRNVLNRYDSGFILEQLLFQYDVNILTSMINMPLLKESGLKFDSKITASEEYCLFMQLASVYEIGVIKTILAKYRVHENSLTSKSLHKLGYERRYTLNRILENNPGLIKKYKKGFQQAYARANYYDTRWLIASNQKFQAFKMMLSTSFVSKNYFALTLLTLTPKRLWDLVHLKFRNRT